MKTVIQPVSIQGLRITDENLIAELTDGRVVSVPLAWYPRLLHGNSGERDHWQFIGNGQGIHWPDLDEDISLESILLGKGSGESNSSFRQWLDSRD